MLDSRPMRADELDYFLPQNHIAQSPLPDRTSARLMVLRQNQRKPEHRLISDLPNLLDVGDLLVLNNTQVIPARVLGHRKDTGGKVEALFVEPLHNGLWETMIRTRARLTPGCSLVFGPAAELVAEVMEKLTNGRYILKPTSNQPLLKMLETIGLTPLPPYIKRPAHNEDRQRYQTVYACNPGAIAAPTAGLHFTEELLLNLQQHGIAHTSVTLHVGPGTFQPVQSTSLHKHTMESERYYINQAAAKLITKTRQTDSRVIAVGSTAVRTLETAASDKGFIAEGQGRSGIFIYPPYQFKAVDAMLTNFHLPRSTPLAMVCALAGKDKVMAAYQEAIHENYRFYSYGDAMLIM